MFNTSTIETLFFEDFVSTASRQDVIDYKNARDLDLYVCSDASTELIVADLRCSLYIQLDLSSSDKTKALNELNRLKSLEIQDENLFS